MTDQEEPKQQSTTEPPSALSQAPLIDPPIPGEPAVEPATESHLDKSHSNFAAFHEGYVRHYIALADTKAGVIFTIVAGIIGYLLSNNDIRNAVLTPSFSISFGTSVLSLLILGVVAALSFLVIAPRLASQSDESLVFFGSVAERANSETYVQDIAECSAADLTKARLKHSYDISRICSKKYALLKKAIWLAPLSLSFALATILLN